MKVISWNVNGLGNGRKSGVGEEGDILGLSDLVFILKIKLE